MAYRAYKRGGGGGGGAHVTNEGALVSSGMKANQNFYQLSDMRSSLKKKKRASQLSARSHKSNQKARVSGVNSSRDQFMGNNKYSTPQHRGVKRHSIGGVSKFGFTQSQKRGYSFGNSTPRNASVKSQDILDNPGPGNYKQSSFITAGPKYTILLPYKKKYESIPGPGDYDAKL